MKSFTFLVPCFCFFCIACKSPAQHQEDQMKEAMQTLMEGNTWPLDTTSFREIKRERTPYEHLANIGDCFAFADSGKYYGILLYDISKTVDGIEYNFLIQPNAYQSIPDFNEFKHHSFVGVTIPNEITKRKEIGFMLYGFWQDDFAKIFPTLRLIGHTDLSAQEERFGGQSVPGTLPRLTESIIGHQESIKDPTAKTSFLDGPRDTAFSFSLLKTSIGIAGKKEPYFTWILSKKTAHPIALKLLKDDYWWEAANDFAPFGNDDGHDAIYGFREWRLAHPAEEPANYFDEMAASWETSFEQKDWTDYKMIKKKRDADILYTSIDYAIVGVAFGQLVLEGKISSTLKEYGVKAIKRQQMLTEKGDYPYAGALKKERMDTWSKQLKVLEKAPE